MSFTYAERWIYRGNPWEASLGRDRLRARRERRVWRTQDVSGSRVRRLGTCWRCRKTLHRPSDPGLNQKGHENLSKLPKDLSKIPLGSTFVFLVKTRKRKGELLPYPAQRLRSPVAVSSSSEEATSALTGAHFLLRRVELRGRELLSPSLVGYDALLYLLIVSSDPKDLPGSYDAIVKSIHHVEDVSATEAHLAFLRLLIVEVGPTHFVKIHFVDCNCSPGVNMISFDNLSRATNYKCWWQFRLMIRQFYLCIDMQFVVTVK